LSPHTCRRRQVQPTASRSARCLDSGGGFNYNHDPCIAQPNEPWKINDELLVVAITSVLARALAWFLVNDQVKRLAYHLFDLKQPPRGGVLARCHSILRG
jgi:hypothetical protein